MKYSLINFWDLIFHPWLFKLSVSVCVAIKTIVIMDMIWRIICWFFFRIIQTLQQTAQLI